VDLTLPKGVNLVSYLQDRAFQRFPGLGRLGIGRNLLGLEGTLKFYFGEGIKELPLLGLDLQFFLKIIIGWLGRPLKEVWKVRNVKRGPKGALLPGIGG